jgi:hypothetical protein
MKKIIYLLIVASLVSCQNKEQKDPYLQSFQDWAKFNLNDPNSIEVNYFTVDSVYNNKDCKSMVNYHKLKIDSLNKTESKYLIDDFHKEQFEKYSFLSKYKMTANISYRIRNENNALV